MTRTPKDIDSALRMITASDLPATEIASAAALLIADALSTVPARLREVAHRMHDAYLPNDPRESEQFRLAISSIEQAGADMHRAFANLSACHVAVSMSTSRETEREEDCG